MLARVRRLLALSMTIALLASGFFPPAAAPRAAAGWTVNRLGYGVIASWGQEGAASIMGFNWQKHLLYWKDYQPSPAAEPDFSAFAPLVESARQHGMHVLVRVDEPPAWANGGAHNAPPTDPATFGRFLGKAARYFKGKVDAWEIWNEPNVAYEWGGTSPNADTFAELLRAAYVEIKTADPAAVVVMGGVSTTGGDFEDLNPPPSHIGDLGYITRLARASQRLGPLFDALGSHPYGGPYPPEQDYTIDNTTTPVGLYFRRPELQREAWYRVTGQWLPVWITEFGWITDWGMGCQWDSHPQGRNAQKVTEQQQADYLVRAFTYARQHWSDWVGPMFVYNLDKALDTPIGQCDLNIPRYFSLIKPNGLESAAFTALKWMDKPGLDCITLTALPPADVRVTALPYRASLPAVLNVRAGC